MEEQEKSSVTIVEKIDIGGVYRLKHHLDYT